MDPLLFKAARDGNIEVFLEFLKNDPLILEDVAATTVDTPLHIAAMLGHLDFENEVLKHKTNVVEYVKELNQHGYNPIHLVAANGHVVVLGMLLEISHELCYLRGKGGLTPLHYAFIKRRADTISLLLSISPRCVMENWTNSEVSLTSKALFAIGNDLTNSEVSLRLSLQSGPGKVRLKIWNSEHKFFSFP